MLEDGNFISDFAFVSPNAVLGKGNVVMEGAIIREGVVMGDNNYVGPYAVIGEVPEKKGYFDKYGKVIIGNNSRFEKQVTVDSGYERDTQIGNNVIMLKNSHVGHGAIIHDNVILSCNSAIGGETEVGEGTNFALGAVAHQRLAIPANCIVGMNGVVTKQSIMRPGYKYAGVPVKELGPNIR